MDRSPNVAQAMDGRGCVKTPDSSLRAQRPRRDEVLNRRRMPLVW